MTGLEGAAAAPDSPLAATDPLLKLCAALCAVGVVATFPAGIGWRQPTLLAVLAAVGLLARVPGRYVGSRLLAATPFIAMAAAIPLVSAVPDGQRVALAVAWKACSAVLLLSMLAATTAVEDLVDSLRRLGAPRGLALTANLMHRYLLVLLGEWRRVARARDCRTGGRVAAGRTRAWANQVSTVFVRGWDRAERVARAMEARGFRGDFPRPPRPRPRFRDLALAAALPLGLLALRIA